MKTRDLVRQIATLVAIVAGIAINSGGVNVADSDVGAIANQTATSILPADYTFAIWAVIFLWTLLFAVHQALPSQRENPLYRRVGWWAALNGIGGGLWTLAFTNQQFVVAWLLMLVLLGALLVASVRTGLGHATPTGRDYWLAYVPFNINFGWIAVATIVNTAQVLQSSLGWGGAPLSPQLWATLLVIVATLLGLWQVLRLGNLPFGLVVAWALVGVAVGQVSAALVSFSAIGAAAVVLLALVALLSMGRGRSWPPRATTPTQS